MDTLTISLEIAAIQEKTRRLALWSFLIHAGAVVLFLVTASQPRPMEETEFTITEITWLDEWLDETVEIEELEIAPVQEEVITEVAVRPKPVIPEPDNSVALVQQRLAALEALAKIRVSKNRIHCVWYILWHGNDYCWCFSL